MNSREGGRARAASVESEEEWTDSESEEEWMEQAGRGCRLGAWAGPQAEHGAGSWLQSSLAYWVMLELLLLKLHLKNQTDRLVPARWRRSLCGM